MDFYIIERKKYQIKKEKFMRFLLMRSLLKKQNEQTK